MNALLTSQQRDDVLATMAELIANERSSILSANKTDVERYDGSDLAMVDRLKVDDSKIEGMILSLSQLIADSDPIGKELYNFKHDNGMNIVNKTAPFGTVLITMNQDPM